MSAENLRHLLAWNAIDDNTWRRQIKRALHFYRIRGSWSRIAAERSIGLIFFNSSLRTRTSMELAATQLGAHSTTLVPGQGTWGFAWDKGTVMDGTEAEHIEEAVGVLSRYYEALGVRVFASLNDYEQDKSEKLLQTFVDAADVPVVNLESAFYHPCQALGDAATITTHFNGDVEDRKFVLSWAPHVKPLPNAVPQSVVLMASRLGMDVTVARPEGYALDEDVMRQARSYAEDRGQTVRETTDQRAACEEADVIYAKSWGGQLGYEDPEREKHVRESHRDWRISADLMNETNDGAFMHCLPVRRNLVVDEEVLDSPRAIHLLQAEFRLHAQKAILEYMWRL
jgi:N-acetylornithine carbamoyltransferase